MIKHHVLILLLFTSFSLHALTKKEVKSYELFAKVLNIIKYDYVDKVDQDKLVGAAIKGMMLELDPHSQYYAPDAYKEMKQDTSGTFGGLGIEITTRNNELTVVSPIEGSPAFKAGIKPRDKIVKIEDAFTKDLTMYECVKRLKGKIGSRITIYVKREGEKDLIKFTLVRKRIREHSVKTKDFGEGILYFRISQFQERTASEFKKNFIKYYDPKKNLKGLIIDLRLNPGGVLNQAVEIVNMFVDKGKIVSMEMRKNKRITNFTATAPDSYLNFPIAVLVDEGSASASEIVAGAMQDHKRGVIVGTKTFGKGTVQNVIDLPDGSGIKLTIAKYYTPKGRSIQTVGVTPDIIVKLNLEEKGKDKKGQKLAEKKSKNTKEDKKPNSEIAEILERDNQLRSAYAYINSVAGIKGR